MNPDTHPATPDISVMFAGLESAMRAVGASVEGLRSDHARELAWRDVTDDRIKRLEDRVRRLWWAVVVLTALAFATGAGVAWLALR